MSSENYWTILRLLDSKNCEAQCSCGVIKKVRTINIKENRSKSCGCRSRSNVVRLGIPDEYSKRLIRIFSAMKERCYNPKNSSYENYGGKGIKIFEDWLENRKLFYLWSISSGYNNNLTIDRINSDEGYSPNNCQWIPLADNISKMCKEHKMNNTGAFCADSYEKVSISNKEKLGRKLKLISTEGELEFKCLIDAAVYIINIKNLNTEPIQIKKNLSACIHGKRKTCHGFTVEVI